jgi:hypothetical protein
MLAVRAAMHVQKYPSASPHTRLIQPMTLHGLYDTLLKRDMKSYAMLAAAASFAWLMFVIERARGDDEEEPVASRFAAPRI